MARASVWEMVVGKTREHVSDPVRRVWAKATAPSYSSRAKALDEYEKKAGKLRAGRPFVVVIREPADAEDPRVAELIAATERSLARANAELIAATERSLARANAMLTIAEEGEAEVKATKAKAKKGAKK